MGPGIGQAGGDNTYEGRRTTRAGKLNQTVFRSLFVFLVWLEFFALQLIFASRALAQGIVTTPIGSEDDEAFDVAIQPDGKIVVAGRSHNGTDNDFAVVRYNPDFSLDMSFGAGGIVTTPVGTSFDAADALAVQPDGKIVVVGSSNQGISYDFAVVRYNPDGTLDGGFGTGGKVTTDMGFSVDLAHDLAIQPDGKIVVVGASNSAGSYRFTVVRYNGDGSLDTATFGAGTAIVTTSLGITARAEAVALQVDGKIVVAPVEDFLSLFTRIRSSGIVSSLPPDIVSYPSSLISRPGCRPGFSVISVSFPCTP